MKINELKKNDVIEYSRADGMDTFTEDRDLVTMVGGKKPGGIIVFGGMFHYELRNLVLTKVWRENEDSEYKVIYEADDSHKYTVMLFKYEWSDTPEEQERFIAENDEELNKILKQYEEKWKTKKGILTHRKGWKING